MLNDEIRINDESRSPKRISFSFLLRHSFIIPSSFVISASSFLCHSQLRKQKCVNVGQLFDALVQGGANAVTCTGARPQ